MSLYYHVDVDRLRGNPHVLYTGYSRLDLKSDFLIELFEAWKSEGQGTKPITERLVANGMGHESVGPNFATELSRHFAAYGYPVYRPEEQDADPGFRWDSHPLVKSGCFVPSANRSGLVVSDGFMNQLVNDYPGISIRGALINAGLDPADAGETRIQSVEKAVKKEKAFMAATGDGYAAAPESSPYDEGELIPLEENPYVEDFSASVSNSIKITFRDRFYSDAAPLLPLGTDRLLRVFEIPSAVLTEKAKEKIMKQIQDLRDEETDDVRKDRNWLKIGFNRLDAMSGLTEQTFIRTGKVFDELGIDAKRKICNDIDSMPRDPMGYFTRKKILELMGLKKSTYYAILHDEEYGIHEKRKAAQDEKDYEIIKKVADYKGFEKGVRQIYMLMPRITDRKMSINRIRRIMRKYGLRTTVRVSKVKRGPFRDLIKKNTKANLLMQQFRLHRPNEVRLTDVTYLDYGYDQRAYGSVSIDPVTGKLIAFVVSEYNDLDLALETLREMDRYPAVNEAVLHSDQGILYMTDAFQQAVAERGMMQSMSKRGYCWDNAPQESFNGHFKDECHYRQCRSMEELRAMIEEYSVYYNTERGMWDRGRMTPVEYEEYLSSMDEEDFREYLKRETMKYEEMKKDAAQKALQQNRDNRQKIKEMEKKRSVK